MCTEDKAKPSRHKKVIPQVPYKKLKQTQKARISNRMFNVVCKYYAEHQAMPPETELEGMCRQMYPIWFPKHLLKICWLCFGKNRLILPNELKRMESPNLENQKLKRPRRKSWL